MPLPADGPVTAGDLLTLEELGHFRRTSTWRGIGLVLHAWGVIASAIALYLFRPSALTLGVAVLVIGARQLGLMVLMHETAHWLLFRQGRLNTWVGTWLCAAPLGVDLKAYRRRHHLHHRHTQTSEDPDLALSAPLPISRGGLAWMLLRDLGGWTALTRLAGWRPWRDGLAATWRRARAPLAANALLCAVLTGLGGWPLYLLTWVMPWATWFQLAGFRRPLRRQLPSRASPARLRAVLEAPRGPGVPARQASRRADGAGGELRGRAFARDDGEGVEPGDAQPRYSQWPLTSEYDRESFHAPPVRRHRAASSSCV